MPPRKRVQLYPGEDNPTMRGGRPNMRSGAIWDGQTAGSAPAVTLPKPQMPEPPQYFEGPILNEGPEFEAPMIEDRAGSFEEEPGDDPAEAIAESQRQQESQTRSAPPDPSQAMGQTTQAGGADFMRRLGNVDDAFGAMDFTPHERLSVFGLRAPQRQPTRSSAHQEAAAANDMMSEGDRKLVSDTFGINVPEGSRWSRIEKIAPAIASAFRAKQQDPLAARKLAVSEGHLGMRGKELGLEQGRLDQAATGLGLRKRSTDIAQMKAGRPPAGQQDKNAAIMRVDKYIDEIERNYDEAKEKIGPVFGRLQQLALKVGYGDPEVARLQSNLRDALGDFLTAKTGAQRGMPEIEFLLSAMPNIAQSNETFETLMDSWKKRIQVDKDVIGRLGGAYGYVNPFDSEPVDNKMQGAQRAGGTVPYKLNGEIFDIPREQEQDFLKANTSATRYTDGQ